MSQKRPSLLNCDRFYLILSLFNLRLVLLVYLELCWLEQFHTWGTWLEHVFFPSESDFRAWSFQSSWIPETLETRLWLNSEIFLQLVNINDHLQRLLWLGLGKLTIGLFFGDLDLNPWRNEAFFGVFFNKVKKTFSVYLGLNSKFSFMTWTRTWWLEYNLIGSLVSEA